MTARAKAVVALLAVYNGRTHLGDVAELGNGQFRATDSDGKQIGNLLNTCADARSAVMQAGSKQTGIGQ